MLVLKATYYEMLQPQTEMVAWFSFSLFSSHNYIDSMRSNLNIVVPTSSNKNKIDKESVYLFKERIIILMVKHVNDVSLKMKWAERPVLLWVWNMNT